MRDSPAVAWSQMPAPGTPGPDEARPLRRGTGHGGREALERGENHGFGPDALAPPAGSDALVHGAGGHGRPGEEPFLVFAQRTSLQCRAAAGRGHCPVLSCPARCAEPVTGQGQDPRDSRDRHRASRPDDPRLDGRCAAGGLRRGPVRGGQPHGRGQRNQRLYVMASHGQVDSARECHHVAGHARGTVPSVGCRIFQGGGHPRQPWLQQRGAAPGWTVVRR